MTAPVSLRFGPDRRLTAAFAAAAVIIAALAFTTDAAGRVLFAGAVLVLAGYVVTDLVWWPRLSADASGVQVRTPFTRADLTWPQVADVRADLRSRYGLRSATLEIDAGEVLVVFSRRTLGVDPETAAGLVRAMRPPH